MTKSDSTKTIELPAIDFANQKAEIKESLFGFEVKAGDQAVPCDTLLEARYIKILIETGVPEVKMPNNEEDLTNKLTALERKKARVDEASAVYLASMVNPKNRAKLMHMVWQKVYDSARKNRNKLLIAD